MLPTTVGLSTAHRKLPLFILCCAMGPTAHASTQCSGIEDIRALRLALSDETCARVTLAGELPVFSTALTVERSVVLDAGPWSIPPLQLGTDASPDPVVVILDGILTPDRAVDTDAEPAAYSGTTPRTLPVVIEVTREATVFFAATAIAPSTATEAGGASALIPILQHAEGNTTVGLFGVETTAPLTHTLVYQEGRSDAGPCAPNAATFQTGDLSELVTAVTAAGHSAAPLTGDTDEVRPSTIELATGGGLLGTACWSTAAGFSALDSSRTTHLHRLHLSGSASTHTVADSGTLLWSAIDTTGPITATESLFADLTIDDAPLISSASTIRVLHTLAAELTLNDAPMMEAPEVIFDQGVLCDVAGGAAIARVDGGDAPVGIFSRLAVDQLGTALIEAPSGAELTLQHLTVRGTGVEPAPTDAALRLLASYFEGPFDPAELGGASLSAVDGLFLMGAACPSDRAGCTEVPTSALLNDTTDCSNVLQRTFDEETTLSAWSSETPSMPRLQFERPPLEPPRADLNREGDLFSCLDTTEGPSDPSLVVGAWPSSVCGLDLLTTSEQPAVPASTDTADPARVDPTAAYGCAGRSAGLLVVALLPLAGRRRSSTLSDHPSGHGPCP